MRRLALTLLFGAFTAFLICVSASRLMEWYQTGRLAVHKKHPLGGPDVLTYASDPIGFTIEFDLDLFLLTMGVLGALLACRDMLLQLLGPQIFPQSLLDVRRGFRFVVLCYWIVAGTLLVAAAMNRAT